MSFYNNSFLDKNERIQEKVQFTVTTTKESEATCLKPWQDTNNSLTAS